jgi:hypothetical protein
MLTRVWAVRTGISLDSLKDYRRKMVVYAMSESSMCGYGQCRNGTKHVIIFQAMLECRASSHVEVGQIHWRSEQPLTK